MVALAFFQSDSLPWTVRPEKLQHEVERIQHEAAEESRRERAEAAAERARLVEEAQEAWAAYERVPTSSPVDVCQEALS